MSHPFVATGTADQIMEVLAGPRQHDRHCQAWRWEQYLADSKARHANMLEGARQIIAARNAREETTYAQAAE